MKKISVLLIVVLIFMIGLTVGCGDNTEKDPTDKNSSITTNILSGGTNDKWFMLSNGFAEALNRSYPGSILNIGPGNPTANLLSVNDGEAEFGLFHTSIAVEAYKGLGQFEEPKDKITTVATLYPSPAQMIFRLDSGITSFDEIIENKIPVNISIGRTGGNIQSTFDKIMEFYGITYEDMEDWGCNVYQKGFTDTSDMFADEIIDGFFLVAGAPTVFATQLSVNIEMVMLDFDQEMMDSICSKYGYALMTVPKDVYTFMYKDLETFTAYNIVGASSATPEDTVYKMTKAIYENMEYIQSLHASFLDITKETIALEYGVPYHPGAIKYYKEIGLMD